MRTFSDRAAGIRVKWLFLFGISTALFFAGCGGTDDGIERLPLYPVSGTVKMDGEPFGPISLRFEPAGEVAESRGFVADADENGNFEFVTTYEAGDGAPAGAYTVTVFSSMGTGQPFPAVYELARTSPLSATISEVSGEGGNTLEIQLESTAGAPAQNTTTGNLTPEQFSPGITN